MAVDAPGVGALGAGEQVRGGAGVAAAQSPNAPSTWIQVEPYAAAASATASNGSNAPLLTLPAERQMRAGAVGARERGGELVGAQAALLVGGDRLDGAGADAEHPQRGVDRRVRLFADDHAQRRRLPEPVARRRPSRPGAAARRGPPPGT